MWKHTKLLQEKIMLIFISSSIAVMTVWCLLDLHAGAGGACCKKLPEALHVSNRVNASHLQGGPALAKAEPTVAALLR